MRSLRHDAIDKYSSVPGGQKGKLSSAACSKNSIEIKDLQNQRTNLLDPDRKSASLRFMAGESLTANAKLVASRPVVPVCKSLICMKAKSHLERQLTAGEPGDGVRARPILRE